MWRLKTVYPTGRRMKKTWRSICLEMLCAMSVTKNSQLKKTRSKLQKPFMDIPWHNLTLDITVTKF